jgi:hypothetical protein
MAAVLAGPKRMVNADGTIAGDSAAPCGARTAAKTVCCWAPERSALVKGTDPLVSLVSEVSGFLSPEWNPFYYFFHSKLMSFLKKFD